MKRAWITPPGSLSGYLSRTICIPEDEDGYFEAAFVGALLYLADPSHWESVGGLSPEETAAAWQETLDRYLARQDCM